MNFNSNNKGGYNASYLRQKLIELADESPFFNIRKVLVPFENSDLLRIPTVGEVFGDADTNIYDICVMDGAKQWELMSERINRMEIGWLQNKVGRSGFACTDRYGLVNLNVRAGVPNIVRPVFQVAA